MYMYPSFHCICVLISHFLRHLVLVLLLFSFRLTLVFCWLTGCIRQIESILDFIIFKLVMKNGVRKEWESGFDLSLHYFFVKF
uniref:Secreted protein n=1 Tax=Brugia timori TaxID=42155 RepID=A0A0R3Q8Z2_9BILA